MKKIKNYIILLIFILLLSGCQRDKSLSAETLIVKDYNGVDMEKLNHYKIEMNLNEEDKIYTAKQWVTYTNNTDVDLEELYFNIYPNAFKTFEQAPILFSQKEIMNSAAYQEGYMDIEKISVGKKNLDFKLDKKYNTILNIKLNETLKKGDKTTIYFEYKVKLPSAKDRFGYGDNIINGGNWYPIACVYDKSGWNLDPYYKLGDPFYSDISNYDVSITTDKEVIVATSGNILEEKIDGNKKTYIAEGRLIRDFAFSASKDFIVKEKKIDDTIIKLYSIQDNTSMINESLKIGENSIKVFNRVFGKYPYGQYSIVITEFPSGMEYPGIVFISSDYFNAHSKSFLERVIVHETAHQWWYGLVGNNQIEEAWLDESLTTYSEVIYMEEVYGKGEAVDYYNENIKIGYEYGSEYLGSNQVINKPLNEFTGWDDYGILVYIKGAMFINNIREDYGLEVLYDILNKYFNRYKFYIANTEDFINVCEEVTKDSFDDKVNKWLFGK